MSAKNIIVIVNIACQLKSIIVQLNHFPSSPPKKEHDEIKIKT